MTTIPPARRRKLSEEVRERLLELIRGGGFAPGAPLPSERELMERLGVGRPAIREALQALETIGLIEIRHGAPARVAEPSVARMVDQIGETMKHVLSHSPATLENLKEARGTFEREIARIAAKRRSANDLARLADVLEEQAAARGDAARFRRLDGRFHREIAGMAGNPIFAALVDATFGWLSDFHADLVSAPGLEDLTLREHRQILDAIGRGDADGAAAAMGDHLMRANDLYRRSNLRPPSAVAPGCEPPQN
jgi:DNA-binding FadR family transcriptional regulator